MIRAALAGSNLITTRSGYHLLWAATGRDPPYGGPLTPNPGIRIDFRMPLDLRRKQQRHRRQQSEKTKMNCKALAHGFDESGFALAMPRLGNIRFKLGWRYLRLQETWDVADPIPRLGLYRPVGGTSASTLCRAHIPLTSVLNPADKTSCPQFSAANVFAP